MKRFQIVILVLILILILSCDFPEHYFEPAPECKSEMPDSLIKKNQYKLIDILRNKNSNDYRYFFKTFKEVGNSTFMVINFRDEESCFDIEILVDEWSKLKGMRRTNGFSYPTELYDLKWEIKSINGDEIVKYIDMHRIID